MTVTFKIFANRSNVTVSQLALGKDIEFAILSKPLQQLDDLLALL